VEITAILAVSLTFMVEWSGVISLKMLMIRNETLDIQGADEVNRVRMAVLRNEADGSEMLESTGKLGHTFGIQINKFDMRETLRIILAPR
jgi:hypothetical protein